METQQTPPELIISGMLFHYFVAENLFPVRSCSCRLCTTIDVSFSFKKRKEKKKFSMFTSIVRGLCLILIAFNPCYSSGVLHVWQTSTKLLHLSKIRPKTSTQTFFKLCCENILLCEVTCSKLRSPWVDLKAEQEEVWRRERADGTCRDEHVAAWQMAEEQAGWLCDRKEEKNLHWLKQIWSSQTTDDGIIWQQRQ